MNLKFPGLSETGEWTYEELLDLGFLPDTLEKIGLVEGQKAIVQFDAHNKPYLSPSDDNSWKDDLFAGGGF